MPFLATWELHASYKNKNDLAILKKKVIACTFLLHTLIHGKIKVATV